MKKILYTVVTFVLFLFLLMQPIEAVTAAKSGLLLWFNVIIPNLLPFIILSNVIILLNVTRYFTFFLSPLFCRLLKIPKAGCYAILLGFLCGYPIGAKVCSDLVKENQISKEDGQYLLCFCNNVSPAFVLNYILQESFHSHYSAIPVFILLYLPPILCALLCRPLIRRKKDSPHHDLSGFPSIGHPVDFTLFDEAIMNGFESIAKLGGYIILFSILAKLILHITLPCFLPHCILVGLTEITNGIVCIMQSSLTLGQKYIAVLAVTSFGGLSSVAQTQSMLKGSGLALAPYFLSKLFCMFVTTILSLLYVSAL